MRLSRDAFDIACAVRVYAGADVHGVGPDIPTLLTLDEVGDKSGLAIRTALKELERHGYFAVDYCIGVPKPGIPKELRDIAGVSILERMQQRLDGMDL